MRSAEHGFTLVELLLVLLVGLILLLGVLGLFDGMNRMATVQSDLSRLQQSQRVAQDELVQMVRMAGLGGLLDQPTGPSVARTAPVEVRNNVGLGGSSREVVAGSGELAMEGSDVLTLRGVFTTPVYRVDYVDPGSWDPVNLRLVVRDVTPTGVEQDLEPLREAIREERAEALVLTDALGDNYGVAELDPGASVPTADRVVLALRTGGTARSLRYSTLSSGGAFPAIAKVLSVGLLEEYRYYVKPGEPGDPAADPLSALAYARVFPATEEVYDGQLAVPVASNVLDLQVSLGFDSSLAGGFFDCDDDVVGDDDLVVENADGAGDDWLFNQPGAAAGEDDAQAPWSPPAGGWTTSPSACSDTPRPVLYYVRLATLARTPGADPRYRAPPLVSLADRSYPLAADDPINGEVARRYRRRILETTVDLRNL